MAREAWQRGDRERALAALDRACQLVLGQCELYAATLRDVDRRSEARAVLASASKRGQLDLCGIAGEGFLRVEPRDPARAREMFEHGCSRGDARTCYNLGVAYSRRWLEGSPGEPLRLFDLACRKGLNSGCQNLAVLYATPGPQYDEDRAVAMFQTLCDRGEIISCVDLGDRLATGRGVRQDLPRGLALLSTACKSDSGYGCAF